MLIKVSIEQIRLPGYSTEAKKGGKNPRGREKHWTSLPTFDEGWWCSGGVTRLVARVGGWCAVDHWFKPGKFIVDERRQNRGWLLLKCWIQTSLPFSLSACLPWLTFLIRPRNGEKSIWPPSPSSRRDITASHPWIYSPQRDSRVPLPFLRISISFELCPGTYNI